MKLELLSLYNNMKTAVCAMLTAHGVVVSGTTDLWTFLMLVTTTWQQQCCFDQLFKQHVFTLHMLPLPQLNHTAMNVASKFQSVLNEWNIFVHYFMIVIDHATYRIVYLISMISLKAGNMQMNITFTTLIACVALSMVAEAVDTVCFSGHVWIVVDAIIVTPSKWPVCIPSDSTIRGQMINDC